MIEDQAADQALDTDSVQDDVSDAMERFEPIDDLLDRCENISVSVANRKVPSRNVAA